MANEKRKEMKFTIMSAKGDEQYTYELDIARTKFDELMALGQYTPMAMVVGAAGGATPEVLPGFRGDLEEVIWIPKIAGG